MKLQNNFASAKKQKFYEEIDGYDDEFGKFLIVQKLFFYFIYVNYFIYS